MATNRAQIRLRSTIDPPCKSHQDTEAVFVCCKTECNDALACPKCIVKGGNHYCHDMTLLQDILDSSKTKIAEFNGNTRSQVLGPLKKKSEKAAADLLVYEDSTSVLLKEIEKRGDTLHSQVDEMVNEHKQKCRQIRASNLEVLEQYQHDLLAKIAEVEEDVTKLEDCIESTCKGDIINAAKTGISKTYPSIDYPRSVDVSFQQSEKPLQDMECFMGRIIVGNDQTERKETDQEKIKRFEAEIQEFTKREKTDAAKIKRLESMIQELGERKEIASARIQASQANTDRLTKKLQDQKKDSKKKEKQMEEKIKELEKRLSECSSQPASRQYVQKPPTSAKTLCTTGCGRQIQSCSCKTCPKCSYTGNDIKCPGCGRRKEDCTCWFKDYEYLSHWGWKCPKCSGAFKYS